MIYSFCNWEAGDQRSLLCDSFDLFWRDRCRKVPQLLLQSLNIVEIFSLVIAGTAAGYSLLLWRSPACSNKWRKSASTVRITLGDDRRESDPMEFLQNLHGIHQDLLAG
jgi:hypothetical protein